MITPLPRFTESKFILAIIPHHLGQTQSPILITDSQKNNNVFIQVFSLVKRLDPFDVGSARAPNVYVPPEGRPLVVAADLHAGRDPYTTNSGTNGVAAHALLVAGLLVARYPFLYSYCGL
jgi:hypothetical protein